MSTLGEKFAAWRANQAFRKNRIAFLEDMGEVLIAGQSGLQKRLQALADRNRGKLIEVAYRSIYNSLNRGISLPESMKPYYNSKEFQLIGAYDAGAADDAQLGDGFLTAAKILGPLDDMRRGAIKLLVNTSMSLAMVVVMWIGIAGGFAHDMEQMQPRKLWPTISKWVIGSGEMLATHYILAVLLFAALVGLVLWAFPNWTGDARHWADKRVPGFVIYKEYRSVLALVALASFMSAKSGLRWSFDKLAEQSNRWEREYIDEMRRRSTIRSGVEMLDVGYFSDRIIDRLTLREGSGTLEESLAYVAVRNSDKLSESLKSRLEVAGKVAGDVSKIAAGIVVVAVVMINVSSLQSMSHLGH
jgi:type II secretory pathway component PulF